MKKTLPILSIAAIVLAAVAIMVTVIPSRTKKAEAVPDLTLSASDTAGLADFQEWKAQNERKDPSLYYTGAVQQAATVPATRTVVKKVYVPAKTSTSATAPVASKKKGWSKAAKGTAIGTVAGATAGAIISKKNRVLGGVIGGIIGGGAGYGIGRGMDKKDGRVN